MSSKQGWAACNQIPAIHSLTATFFRVWAELIRPHQTWPIRLSSCYHPLQGLIWGHPALQLAWGKGAKVTGLWVSSALQGCLFPCPVQHHGQSPVPRLVKDGALGLRTKFQRAEMQRLLSLRHIIRLLTNAGFDSK